MGFLELPLSVSVEVFSFYSPVSSRLVCLFVFFFSLGLPFFSFSSVTFFLGSGSFDLSGFLVRSRLFW